MKNGYERELEKNIYIGVHEIEIPAEPANGKYYHCGKPIELYRAGVAKLLKDKFGIVGKGVLK